MVKHGIIFYDHYPCLNEGDRSTLIFRGMDIKDANGDSIKPIISTHPLHDLHIQSLESKHLFSTDSSLKCRGVTKIKVKPSIQREIEKLKTNNLNVMEYIGKLRKKEDRFVVILDIIFIVNVEIMIYLPLMIN